MGRKYPLHEVVERERKVLELRLAHANWSAIAQAVGYASPGAAHNAYKRALVRTLQEPAEEIRSQERERLDRLSQRYFTQALQGDMAAANFYLKVAEQRAKLLGLHITNIKQDITINEGGNDFNERVRELAYLVARNKTDASGLDGGVSPMVAGSSPSESGTN